MKITSFGWRIGVALLALAFTACAGPMQAAAPPWYYCVPTVLSNSMGQQFEALECFPRSGPAPTIPAPANHKKKPDAQTMLPVKKADTTDSVYDQIGGAPVTGPAIAGVRKPGMEFDV